MKIKTVQMSYENVLKLPRPKHRDPLKPSRLLATVVRVASLPTLMKTKFSYTTDRMELVGDQPCLILMNHSSFTDMKLAYACFLSQALRHRHLYRRHRRYLGQADALSGLHPYP